jgi:hypothetical protein
MVKLPVVMASSFKIQSETGERKIRLWVLWSPEPRITVLAKVSRNLHNRIYWTLIQLMTTTHKPVFSVTLLPTAGVPLLSFSRPRRLANISRQPHTLTHCLQLNSVPKVKVTLLQTISRSVSPGFEPHLGLVTGH